MFVANSRAFGDFAFKLNGSKGQDEQEIIPFPDFRSFERNDDDDFLIIASDGLWEFMTIQEVIEFITLRKDAKITVDACCDQMIQECLARGSHDNISIIIVFFQ